jgi:hypothetical protein
MALTKLRTVQLPAVTTVDTPGLDTTIPTEQAVREAIAAAAPSIPTFVTREAPSGTKNGSNPTFTLAHDPAGTLSLYLNGQLMFPTGDYTISTVTITMIQVVESTDVLLASYRY